MYKLVVAGGTFDLLHKGHKSFLQNILNQAEYLVLGLTSDDYVSKNKLGNIENYEVRKKNLELFFDSIEKKDFVEIVQIEDIYGPLLNSDFNPDVIAVTEATKNSVEKINQKRKGQGLQILQPLIIPMDLAEDGLEISSTRIRNGEIDREGKLYFKKEWEQKNFSLPDSLRRELSKPFGAVLQNIPDNLDGSKIITVGDKTTKLFNQKNIDQFLSVIDLKIKREKMFDSVSQLEFEEDVKIYKVQNSHGEITAELFDLVNELIHKKERSVILIDGEDDLAVLPCLIFSPLGVKVFYGQPNEGLVEVDVNPENKSKAYRLLSSFLLS